MGKEKIEAHALQTAGCLDSELRIVLEELLY
jgi:hypothetical protein